MRIMRHYLEIIIIIISKLLLLLSKKHSFSENDYVHTKKDLTEIQKPIPDIRKRSKNLILKCKRNVSQDIKAPTEHDYQNNA